MATLPCGDVSGQPPFANAGACYHLQQCSDPVFSPRSGSDFFLSESEARLRKIRIQIHEKNVQKLIVQNKFI